jgi:hypothetical protein
MVVIFKVLASSTVFTTAFFALSGASAPIDTGGTLQALGALATAAIFLFIAGVARRRATAMADRRHLARTQADAEGLMRMDTDKG